MSAQAASKQAEAVIQQIDPMYLNFTQSAAGVIKLRRAMEAGQRKRAGGSHAASVRLLLEDGSEYARPGKLLFSDLTVDATTGQITRRADIRQAEQQLIAAKASIGAARAAFFPRISLTASAASGELSGLFKSGSWGWTLAPQALLPIFDAGRNQANLNASNVGRDIAVVQYKKAIQTALREVADAMAGRATLDEQLQAQQAQADAEADRFRLADLRYRNGVASYLELLDAKRSLFGVQQAVLQTRLAYCRTRSPLYKALGVGWRDAGATR